MLELKHISKTFFPGTVNAKTALDDLSLTLHDGDFVTVIGGNGAGKSTMLNAVAGTFTVDSGSILLDGEDITRKPEHRRAADLGRVFQDPMMGTAGDMWIEENLALAARRGSRRTFKWGISHAEREQYRALLAPLGLGLEDRLTTKVGLLSGGQRQALTLLMASLKKPKLLLLDEHTAALDPKTAAKVLELSDRIVAENGLTTMMVTHNMKDAIAHGNRLIMMNGGRVVLDIAGEEKKRLTVEDLLYGLLLESGNDAAMALAGLEPEGCGGFVEKMNEKARALGLENTHFCNPSGLSDPEHYTTALELAQITAAAMADPRFAAIVGTRSTQRAGRTLHNHNRLLELPGFCGV